LAAVQLTLAELEAPAAVTLVGADGAVGAVGVTALEGDDAGPLPAPLIACTVKVYVVPPVSPLTVPLVAGAVTVVGVCAVEPMNGVIL
jgi:hypothetical protein